MARLKLPRRSLRLLENETRKRPRACRAVTETRPRPSQTTSSAKLSGRPPKNKQKHKISKSGPSVPKPSSQTPQKKPKPKISNLKPPPVANPPPTEAQSAADHSDSATQDGPAYPEPAFGHHLKSYISMQSLKQQGQLRASLGDDKMLDAVADASARLVASTAEGDRGRDIGVVRQGWQRLRGSMRENLDDLERVAGEETRRLGDCEKFLGEYVVRRGR